MRTARRFLLASIISVAAACGGSDELATEQTKLDAAGDTDEEHTGTAVADALATTPEGGSADGGKDSTAKDGAATDQQGPDASDGARQDGVSTKPDAATNTDAATDMRPDASVGTLPVNEGAVLGGGQEADNVTSYVLTAGADGSAYVAGFTSDWARLGLADPGRAGVPFVARIETNGNVAWAAALPATWWPYAVALDGDELIVVSAALDIPALSAFSYSSSYAVARVSPQGSITTRKTFSYATSVRPSAVLVDGAHAIHVAASTSTTSSTRPGMNDAFEVARLNTDLSVDKVTKFPHAGSNATINALKLARNGDVLLAGYFDDSINFGGGALQTKNLGSYYACAGFFARLTRDHDYVIATQLGGDNFADVIDLVEKDGSIYLGGAITGPATIGGISVTGDAEASGFIAKLNAQAKAEWVSVWPGRSWVSALAAGTTRIIAGGSMGDARYIVQDVRDKPAQPDQATLTLNTEKINPITLTAGGNGFWLSLGFHDRITLAPTDRQVQGKASTLLLRLAQ